MEGMVINYGEGREGYKIGELRVRNFLRHPPPLKTRTTFTLPLSKHGSFCAPPLQYG